jgi:hypothetical protein
MVRTSFYGHGHALIRAAVTTYGVCPHFYKPDVDEVLDILARKRARDRVEFVKERLEYAHKLREVRRWVLYFHHLFADCFCSTYQYGATICIVGKLGLSKEGAKSFLSLPGLYSCTNCRFPCLLARYHSNPISYLSPATFD